MLLVAPQGPTLSTYRANKPYLPIPLHRVEHDATAVHVLAAANCAGKPLRKGPTISNLLRATTHNAGSSFYLLCYSTVPQKCA
jgi:hypothetical protein